MARKLDEGERERNKRGERKREEREKKKRREEVGRRVAFGNVFSICDSVSIYNEMDELQQR